MSKEEVGWTQIAYMNDIVVLFPQVLIHCWDNWNPSVSEEDFATNEGF